MALCDESWEILTLVIDFTFPTSYEQNGYEVLINL
jgi:hypothetical protein